MPKLCYLKFWENKIGIHRLNGICAEMFFSITSHDVSNQIWIYQKKTQNERLNKWSKVYFQNLSQTKLLFFTFQFDIEFANHSCSTNPRTLLVASIESKRWVNYPCVNGYKTAEIAHVKEKRYLEIPLNEVKWHPKIEIIYFWRRRKISTIT